MKYAWIERHRKDWPVSLTCQVLGVSPSGYHERNRRERALAQTQHVLVALGIDAQRQQDHAVTEVDAVDHHHRQIQLADGPREPLRELLPAELHEAARDRALGRRARLMFGRHRLLGAGVEPGRHARGDGCHGGSVQRVVASGPLEAAQRQLAPGRAACSWASHRNALAAQHDLAGGGAAAHGSSACVRDAFGTAQGGSIGLHHRSQHLLAGLDAQAQERVTYVAQHPLHGQRDLNLRGRHHPQCGLRVKLHLGGSFGCL